MMTVEWVLILVREAHAAKASLDEALKNERTIAAALRKAGEARKDAYARWCAARARALEAMDPGLVHPEETIAETSEVANETISALAHSDRDVRPGNLS